MILLPYKREESLVAKFYPVWTTFNCVLSHWIILEYRGPWVAH